MNGEMKLMKVLGYLKKKLKFGTITKIIKREFKEGE
jgi:hypothetical protein